MTQDEHIARLAAWIVHLEEQLEDLQQERVILLDEIQNLREMLNDPE